MQKFAVLHKPTNRFLTIKSIFPKGSQVSISLHRDTSSMLAVFNSKSEALSAIGEEVVTLTGQEGSIVHRYDISGFAGNASDYEVVLVTF